MRFMFMCLDSSCYCNVIFRHNNLSLSFDVSPVLGPPPHSSHSPLLSGSHSQLAPQTEPSFAQGYDSFEPQYNERPFPAANNYDSGSNYGSRQNSLHVTAAAAGARGSDAPAQYGSQSLRGQSPHPLDQPFSQGSSRDALYPAGSQSQLNRSNAGGSQLRLAGAPAATGSERGSQLMPLPVASHLQPPYDDRSLIPRQDSAILMQGGYNLAVLRAASPAAGGGRCLHAIFTPLLFVSFST